MRFGIFCLIIIFVSIFEAVNALGYQFTFTPQITVSEEYTDNLFNSESNEKDDLITTISPRFSAELSGKYGGAELSYAPGAVFYDKYTEYNTWRHNVALTGWKEIARNTRLEFRDSFMRTEDPDGMGEDIVDGDGDEEPLIEADRTVRKGREPYYTNAAGLTLSHQFGADDSVYLGYLYGILRNEDPEEEDNDRHTLSTGIAYRFTPHIGIDTNVSYTRGLFSGDSDDTDEWQGSIRLTRSFSRNFDGFVQYAHTYFDYKGDDEDYQVYDSSVGIDYVFSEDAHLSLSLGYFIQDREVSEDETGLSINGVLGKTWTFRRGSINLTGSTGYDSAEFGAENLGFTIYQQAGCRSEYGFTRQLRGNIYGSYRRDKYVNTEDDRKDRTRNLGAGLTFQPERWVALRLDYSYSVIDSTENENGSRENRVFLSVTLSLSRPFRVVY